MDCFPLKIDWGDFQANFPSFEVTWERDLRAELNDYPTADQNTDYATVCNELSGTLTTPVRDALRLFTAATSICEIEEQDFEDYSHPGEFDREAFMYVPQPKLEPSQMASAYAAMNVLRRENYIDQISTAFVLSDDLPKRFYEFTDLESYLRYLAAWIDVIEEIHGDGCVLGLGGS